MVYGIETEKIAVPDVFKEGGASYNLPLQVWFGIQSFTNIANTEQITQVRARWA